jgi:DNA-binding NarL/FixJ family response regulator
MVNGNARPSVLVADDHPQVLEAVSRLLEADFRLVAATTDGQHALESSIRLDPDVVVLDITMPGLNGFQVARELKRTGARAKIVFLTMHAADDYVATAIASGAHGYVLKTRMQPDLKSALHHVLAGRLFMPTLAALAAAAGSESGHAVYFYEDDASFLDEASGFVSTTLRRGEPVVIAATEATCNGILERLKTQGLDLAGSPGQGWCRVVDSAVVVAQCMRDGWPDAQRVGELIDGFERSRLATPWGPSPRVTVFSAMNVQLRKDHRSEAAVAFDQLWATLTGTRPFFTVCAYPVDRSASDGFPDMCARLCAQHGMVSYARMTRQS